MLSGSCLAGPGHSELCTMACQEQGVVQLMKEPLQANGRPNGRVKAALGKGIAPQDPPGGQGAALAEPKLLVSLHRVAGAGWQEAAGLWQQR